MNLIGIGDKVITRFQKDKLTVMREVVFEGTEYQLIEKYKKDKEFEGIDEKDIICLGTPEYLTIETADTIFNKWRGGYEKTIILGQEVRKDEGYELPTYLRDPRKSGERCVINDQNIVFRHCLKMLNQPKFIIVYTIQIDGYNFKRDGFINTKNL